MGREGEEREREREPSEGREVGKGWRGQVYRKGIWREGGGWGEERRRGREKGEERTEEGSGKVRQIEPWREKYGFA